MMETSGCMMTLAAKNFLTVLAKGRCNMIMMFAVHERLFCCRKGEPVLCQSQSP